jgi:hypothetical protein
MQIDDLDLNPVPRKQFWAGTLNAKIQLFNGVLKSSMFSA